MRHARPVRFPKKHKIIVACVAAAAAVALSIAGVEASSGGSAAAAGDPAGLSASASRATSARVPDRAAAREQAAAITAKKKAAVEAAARKHAAAVAAAKKKAAAEAKKKAAEAAERAREKAAASRSAARTEVKHTTAPVKAAPPAAVVYPNNLDGWIRQSLAVMAVHGIPGTYNGIYRNVMRESSGNPNAINLWDSNAAAGTPSKGLLQTIQPTFDAYHVAGTSWNIYDPVANITAACNYAWHLYGSIDNVNGPY